MPDQARLSVRPSPLVHGRFSFQDEAAGSVQQAHQALRLAEILIRGVIRWRLLPRVAYVQRSGNASPVLRLAAKDEADFASWSMTWSPWGGWFLADVRVGPWMRGRLISTACGAQSLMSGGRIGQQR